MSDTAAVDPKSAFMPEGCEVIVRPMGLLGFLGSARAVAVLRLAESGVTLVTGSALRVGEVVRLRMLMGAYGERFDVEADVAAVEPGETGHVVSFVFRHPSPVMRSCIGMMRVAQNRPRPAA